jgi:hypothetical protein
MTNTRLAVIGVSLLVGGCVGEIEDGGSAPLPPAGGDPTPKAAFDREVDTILVHACIGCHANSPTNPNFVDANAATAYAKNTSVPAVVGDYAPSHAPVLTTVLPGHHGVTYSPAQVTAITDWLNQEVATRKTTPTPPGGTPTNPVGPQAIRAAEDAWSGCLTLGDFQSADMARAWGHLEATDPQEQCMTCHVTGGNDFIASDEQPVFFDFVTTKRKYMLQYFAVDTSLGTPKMVVNYTSFNMVSGGNVAHLEHPTFAFNNDGMTALKTLFDLAEAKRVAGQCNPPTLTE